MKFNPFPAIKTNRLFLRKVKESDWKEVSYLRSDEIVNKFVKRPKAETKKKANDFIRKINNDISKNELIYWAITINDNPNLIGTICLWNFSKVKNTAEIGYDLNPKFHKKGIMNEALKSVVDFGFNALSFDKIEAFTHKDNEGSKRLLEKNGFKFITDRIDENNIDNIIFEIDLPFK